MGSSGRDAAHRLLSVHFCLCGTPRKPILEAREDGKRFWRGRQRVFSMLSLVKGHLGRLWVDTSILKSSGHKVHRTACKKPTASSWGAICFLEGSSHLRIYTEEAPAGILGRICYPHLCLQSFMHITNNFYILFSKTGITIIQGSADFFCKTQMVNISGFKGHRDAIATTELCPCNENTAISNKCL